MVRALGVYRESEFSPGKVGADAAILDAVLAHFAAQGLMTSAIAAPEFIHREFPDCDLILAMCQSEPALERLSAYQSAGVMAVNSAQSIRSCYRDRLGKVITQAQVPVPEGMLVPTSGQRLICTLEPRRGIYVKRGDLHALSIGDVQRVDDEVALGLALKDFAARGIAMAYLQAAVEGRVVKFYGVTGTDYFSVAQAEDGADRSLTARLRGAAQDAAAALGLEVWGGDAIVSGGQFKIVDFNDWPSFERVRDQAAPVIAARVLHLLRREKRENRKEK